VSPSAKLRELTKQDLVDAVHKAKCGKLKNLKGVEHMTKEEIISHLVKSNCPVIKELIESKP
jgi:NADPH-dependent 7-cyano-7-deazaguanine reductase QueF